MTKFTRARVLRKALPHEPRPILELMRRDYSAWDKDASIQFLTPGRGTVTAAFRISPEQIVALRAQIDQAGKIEPLFNVDVINEQGEAVARVEKRLYVRKRK